MQFSKVSSPRDRLLVSLCRLSLCTVLLFLCWALVGRSAFAATAQPYASTTDAFTACDAVASKVINEITGKPETCSSAGQRLPGLASNSAYARSSEYNQQDLDQFPYLGVYIFNNVYYFGMQPRCPSGSAVSFHGEDPIAPLQASFGFESFEYCDEPPPPEPPPEKNAGGGGGNDGGPDATDGGGGGPVNGPPGGYECGNPCNPANGNKFQQETDYVDPTQKLSVLRSYNSTSTEDVGLGVGWTLSFGSRLDISTDGSGQIMVRRPDGRGEPFTSVGTSLWQGDPDTKVTVTQDSSGFLLGRQAGRFERYDTQGRLLSTTSADGEVTSYTYDGSGRLAFVTGPFGHAITFAYDTSGHIASISNSGGQTYRYGYANGNLVSVTFPDGSVRRYVYEKSVFRHALTGIVDETGNRFATFGYDQFGRATVTQHAETTNSVPQEQYVFAYDSDTQVRIAEPNGNTQVLTYETNIGVKHMVTRVDSDGKTVTRRFDPRNNVTSITDQEGRTTTYAYSPTNQLLSKTEAYGTALARTVTYQYLSPTLNLPVAITAPSVSPGRVKTTTIEYGDSSHPTLPTSITQSGYTPSGNRVSRATTVSFNSAGQVIRIDGPRTDASDITQFTYYSCDTGGACGQLQNITNALGQVTTFGSYDANGRLLQKTDANGLQTSYVYDARGRVTTITQTPPVGTARVTSYAYTPVGDISTVMFPDGLALSYLYDAARYLRQVTDNQGNQIVYNYDSTGNRTQIYTYDNGGTLVRRVDYAFDLRNYVLTVNNGGSATRQLHDAVGNLTQQADPNGNPPINNNFDALNRLVQSVNSLGGTTRNNYDVNDKLIQVAAPNGAITQYVYDDLGNVIQEVSADRGTVSYTYDDAGNRTSQTDARGITAVYTYDALNRVISVRYGIGGFLSGLFSGTPEDVTYVYDQGVTAAGCGFGVGRLCQTTDASGDTQYTYDAFGNVVADVHTELGIVYTTRYTYDAMNRVSSMTYPDGRVVNYARDSVGRIQSIDATINNVQTVILSNRFYRPDGLMTSQTFGNGLTEARNYDIQGRLLSNALGTSSGEAGVRTDSRQYVYDPNGNLRQELATRQNGVYAYDALDRLIQEQLTDRSTNATEAFGYTYDPNGNRTSISTANGGQTYTYSSNTNQLVQKGRQAVTLDPAGNTLSDRAGNRVFAYTNAGRLSQVTIAGILKGTYTYNAQGQRTEKVKGDQTFVYHYDINANLIQETRPNGHYLRDYVWADNQPIAQLQWNGSTKQDVLVYIHTDHLNTPRFATDPNQVVQWRWDSEAFGTGRPDTDPDADGLLTNVRLRLPGQYADGESGLYYNWNRYYDTKVGRYVTSDPMSVAEHVRRWRRSLGAPQAVPLAINPYAYGLDNPLRYVDPLGLWEMYGNWGGANWSGGQSGPNMPESPKPPTDSLDACFMMHDYCYAAKDSCSNQSQDIERACDMALLQCMARLPSNTSDWPMPPRNPIYDQNQHSDGADSFRNLANWYFTRKWR